MFSVKTRRREKNVLARQLSLHVCCPAIVIIYPNHVSELPKYGTRTMRRLCDSCQRLRIYCGGTPIVRQANQLTHPLSFSFSFRTAQKSNKKKIITNRQRPRALNGKLRALPATRLPGAIVTLTEVICTVLKLTNHDRLNISINVCIGRKEKKLLSNNSTSRRCHVTRQRKQWRGSVLPQAFEYPNNYYYQVSHPSITLPHIAPRRNKLGITFC